MAGKFNAEEYISELLGQTNYLAPDVFVDDREIPEAKNCIEFFHSQEFIGNMIPTKLFPKQAEVFIKLYAEYCPHCTDMEYWIGSNSNGTSENIPVNESFDRMFQKVQLLEYGVCPKCGAKIEEIIENNDPRPTY